MYHSKDRITTAFKINEVPYYSFVNFFLNAEEFIKMPQMVSQPCFNN